MGSQWSAIKIGERTQSGKLYGFTEANNAVADTTEELGPHQPERNPGFGLARDWKNVARRM